MLLVKMNKRIGRGGVGPMSASCCEEVHAGTWDKCIGSSPPHLETIVMAYFCYSPMVFENAQIWQQFKLNT